MAFRRLVSTQTADFKPLGSAGQRSFELIRREASALGAEHETLFAEPSPSPEGDIIDWYTGAAGTPRRLADADESARAAGRATLERLVGDIQRRAEALQRSTDPEQRRLGEALANAVEVPDEGCVHLVGDRPVLVAWAHHRNTTAPPRGVLTAMVAAPPAPEPSAAPAAITSVADAGQEPPRAETAAAAAPRQAASSGWLWWLLWGTVGVMAATIAWLLLPACGLSGVPGLDFCSRPGDSPMAAEVARRDLLQDELRQLERELGLARQACVPEPVRRAALEEPPPEEEPNEFDERVQREGGRADAMLAITLIWNTLSDLDLWLTCPSGERIYFNRPSGCGGRLDIDQNADGRRTRQPVENIFFDGRPPAGQYRIRVHNYDQRGSEPNHFRVRVRLGGEETLHEGRLSRTGEFRNFSFSFP